MSTVPIKRHPSLKPLSRQHHHSLLLCWKIREGLNRNIELTRIKNYTDWFWDTHLNQHFTLEEQAAFSILSPEDADLVRVRTDRKRLRSLFEDNQNIASSLRLLEKELEAHIRFEERVLFNKIQDTATPEQLKNLNTIHIPDFQDIWKDKFWEE